MKKVGQFLLGISIELAFIGLVFILLMSADIRGATAGITITASLIISATLFTVLFKRPLLQYGIILGTIIPFLFLVYGFWTKYDHDKESTSEPMMAGSQAGSFSKQIASLESYVTDNFAISVTFDTIQENTISITGPINSFIIDLNDFEIDRKKQNVKVAAKSKFEIINDTLFVLYLEPNKVIKKKLEPSTNGFDSISYLGYLPKAGLFVFVDNVSEFGPDYSSIDALTGQIIHGLPLFEAGAEGLYGSVSFCHDIGQLKVPVRLWHKENKEYRLIYEDEIELSSYRNYNRFSISNIGWNKKDFSFNLKVDHDSVKVRLRVLGT